MARCLRFGITLLLALATTVWAQVPPKGFVTTECQGSVMMILLDRSFLVGKYFRIDPINKQGQSVSLSPKLAAQCGYSLSVDFWGNAKFLASVLSCFAQNTNDETYKLAVRIGVSPNSDMSSSSSYMQTMTCPYFPWATREILCERNYMEVSVRRGVPPIGSSFVQDQPEDWSNIKIEAAAADSAVWQVVFHGSEKKSMTVAQAISNGYGISTTPTRIMLRAAYNATEVQLQEIQTVPVAVIRSTTFYKKRWMLMMVDTAVACPIYDTSFTEDMITWKVPRVLTPLVSATPIKDLNVQMGIDGQKLNPETVEEREYKLDVGPNLITVQIPVGADGGYYKSHVLNKTYGTTFFIEAMLEHTWQDEVYDETKYTVLHPITTPFLPRPPHVTNDTVTEDQLFNVTLGTFLPDVELVEIKVGQETLTVPEANLKGYNAQEHSFPNGSKAYTLQVPFEDPNVQSEPTSPVTRTFTLTITYVLNIVPEDIHFTHPAEVIATVKTIIPPTVTGYCDIAQFYIQVTYGNLGRNWIPFVGSTELAGGLLAQYNYSDNATNFWIAVPYNSLDVTYEVIHSSDIRSRLDLTLKDIETMVVVTTFSLSCSFPTKMIECFSNGTMAALAVKVESVPSLLPNLLTLRDPRCRPVYFDAFNAVFYFSVNSCGTTRRFDNNFMIYENEVLFSIPGNSYQFAIACHFQINDTKVVQFMYQDNIQHVIQPGFGDLEVVMRLSLDSSYSIFYESQDYPLVKYLRTPLYFEVELMYSQDPQVDLVLENCWATYSADRNSLPQWDVIVESCEYTADTYKTLFHPVSSNGRVKFPSHFKRFEVKMFSFAEDQDALKGEIYFHCGVVMCDANQISDSLCNKQCVSAKRRIGRSAEWRDAEKAKTFVSSGPVDLVRSVNARRVRHRNSDQIFRHQKQASLDLEGY
ncbi:uncharacterized protein LOC117402219 isoform X2 [Acipenser ruthenus]|uniref:uncharacterized protein LOC117402219 isoform X2 n=1 Tax=Acipenser ruthenus TaxID=7906 RepID=UPI00274276B3|nr:uncharacterized protein LOC117402219 isoform X2 [Acipenser ruthenus]